MVGRERVSEAGRVVRGDGTWRWEDEVGRNWGVREGSGRVLTVRLVTNPLFFSPFLSIFPLFLPFSLNSLLVLAPLFHYHMPSSPLLFAMTLTLPCAESPLFIISTHRDLLARLTLIHT